MDKDIKSLPTIYINKSLDESTEENDDDGGGDDGDDDNEEGSGQINRETVLEWNNSGDQEPPPSNTTAVVLSKDIKHEDSAHDSFLHGVHSEKDSEVRYSTNGTKEDVPPGIGPLSDDEHYPTTTGINPEERGGGVSHTGKNVTPLPGEFPKSQPRKAHIPDWLIVVASLLALALILGVCIAVNSRRRCGQKKKLVINNGKGGIDEKNMGGLNGEASKSQEMVHLVHKEKPEDQTGSHDEFLAIDETQNQQDVALKSGM